MELAKSTDIAEWKPEDYGFNKQIKDEEGEGKNVWKKHYKNKVFILIQLSETLFVVKKEITIKNDDGTKDIKVRVKWHMVIDSKRLADIYLVEGLRG